MDLYKNIVQNTKKLITHITYSNMFFSKSTSHFGGQKGYHEKTQDWIQS